MVYIYMDGKKTTKKVGSAHPRSNDMTRDAVKPNKDRNCRWF